MDQDRPPSPVVALRTRHWFWFLAGVLLFILGPAAVVVQFRSKILVTPWYLPILASVGVALMVRSIWRRRGVVRAIVLAFFVILCGLEWMMFAVGFRSPAYAGPARPGRSIPRFAARLASGEPFTDKDLENGTSTVLLFFRGRW